MFRLNTAAGEPMFEQIEQMIAKYVCMGALEAHEQLPSVRAMAAELGINPNTVAKSYKNLEAHGIIYTIPGKGAFVAANDSAKAFFARKSLVAFRQAVSEAKLAHIEEAALVQELRQIYKGEQKND